MRILALDPSSHVGWAVIDDGEVVTSGSVSFTGDRQQRAGATFKWLRGFDASEFDVWIYERPFARGKDATRCLWGLAGIIEAVGETEGVAVLDAELKTVKGFMAGSGAANKDDMIRAVAELTGITCTTDHEADAIAVGLYAHENITTEE